MTTVGFIGSGLIGSRVAKLAVAAGYDVVVSNSRGPETLAELTAELGPKARAATAVEAAAAGDIVVVSVPFKAYPELPVQELAGKVVLDTNNYYAQRDGDFPAIDSGETTSAELEQKYLAGSHLVKVFNNINFKHLAALPRPKGAADRSALTIAGDHAAAKQTTTEFLDAIGYDTYDVGPLSESWRFEPNTPAYGIPYGGYADSDSTPAGVDAIKTAVDAAKR